MQLEPPIGSLGHWCAYNEYGTLNTRRKLILAYFTDLKVNQSACDMLYCKMTL